MKKDIRIINQMVDTLKLHYYPSDTLTEKEINSYNLFVEDMKHIKKEAMTIKADDNDTRCVKTIINKVSFDVMARTVKSFSALLQNGDIQIALKQMTDKSTNPIIKVEFRSSYLARYGYVHCITHVDKVISSFLPSFKIKVSELHLATDIQGYDFNAMDKDRMTFRNRGLQDFTSVDNTLFGSGQKKTGFSFGKDDFMLRIYDKTHQINLNKNAGAVQVLRWEHNKNYIKDEKVWRIEFQFRRKHLKTLVGKDGILDGFENVLNSIPDLWSYATKRFVHYNLTDDQCVDMYRGYYILSGVKKVLTSETIKKRKQRAGISPIWEAISSFNNTESNFNISRHKELSKPEKEYVVNCYKGMVSCYIKLLKGDWDEQNLTNLLIQADEENLNKKGFSILDSAKLKAVDYMHDMKYQYENNGVITDGFELYQKNLNDSLLKTLKNSTSKEYRDNFMVECAKRGTLIYGSYAKELF